MALRQKRWWVLAALSLLVVAWFLVFGNPARLDMTLEGPAEPVRPGEEATITARSANGECIGKFPRVFEPYVLGMWRQTHPQRSPWWNPGPSGSAFVTLECVMGPVGTVHIPDDVTADRIALCDTDNRCFEVRGDHSG